MSDSDGENGYTSGDLIVHVVERDGDLYTLSFSDGGRSYQMGLVNVATREIVVPFVYNALWFIPGEKLFGVIGEFFDDVPMSYREITYTGSAKRVRIDGQVIGVDRATGCFTLCKTALVDYTPTEQGSGHDGTVILHALLDSDYRPVLGYVIDAIWPETVRFTDGMAIVQTGSTTWVGDFRWLMGNGKYGVIDTAGRFLVEPKYDRLQYLGGNRFTAQDGETLTTITIDRQLAD